MVAPQTISPAIVSIHNETILNPVTYTRPFVFNASTESGKVYDCNGTQLSGTNGSYKKNPNSSEGQEVTTLDTENYGVKEIQIYPNPNNGQFSIKFDNSMAKKELKIQLYDMLGSNVMDKEKLSNEDVIGINELTKGSYLVHIMGEGISHKIKVVVQ